MHFVPSALGIFLCTKSTPSPAPINLSFAFVSQKHLRPKLLEQTKAISLPLSPAAHLPPPPSSSGTQMASHQTGWREGSQLHLFINEGPRRGRHGGSVGYRPCLLAPSWHPKRGAGLTRDLPGSGPSAGALAHLPPMVGGRRWSARSSTSGKGRQEKPAGSPVVSCSWWTGRSGPWWRNDRSSQAMGWEQGSCQQSGQCVVGCLLQWPQVLHLCLPQFSASKP